MCGGDVTLRAEAGVPGAGHSNRAAVIGERDGTRHAINDAKVGGMMWNERDGPRAARGGGTMRLSILCAMAAIFVGGASSARADEARDEARRVTESATVFNELMKTPDQAIPGNILEKAEAIAIFPSLAKGGFVVGGQFGRGVITVRDVKTRRWSAPAFLTLSGGSFGAQIGATAIDLILVVTNRRGVEHLLANEFKIGGEASVAVGPVGRAAEAATDAALRAEILSYSRSRGLFAGATISGSVVKEDRDANERYYGKAYTSEDIVFARYSHMPESAKILQRTLARQVPPTT
jgi:lipid-binding SYLF domain-containing protein